MSRPDDRRYAKSHEWALMEGDLVVIGITDFAVHELSDLVFIDLPDADTHVAIGESFGEIESVKAVSELMAPIAGTVVEVNTELENSLETIVESPFEDGWMIKMRPDNKADYEALLALKDYQAQLKENE